MFVSNEKSYKMLLNFRNRMREYDAAVEKGKGTYGHFARLVGMHMNMVFPTVRGLHRDHIVPKSFCRKIGVTVRQTNNRDNLRYISPTVNIDKWSFMEEEELAHLKVMCKVWEIDFPTQKIIDEHNASSLIKRKSLKNAK